MSFEGLVKAETRGQDGATNVWLTPRYILEALGPFDLDPASCPGYETARKHYYEADNGLYCDWDGLLVQPGRPGEEELPRSAFVLTYEEAQG